MVLAYLVALIVGLPGSALAEEPPLVPEAGTLELGLYGGLWIPPTDHELYDVRSSVQRPLKTLNPSVGLRAGYYPLSFLGAEVEGGLMPTALRAPEEGSALAFHLRVQGVLQVPLTLAPFLTMGYGNYFISSKPEVLGGDGDATLHLGVGAKLLLSERVLLRLDLRWLITGQEEPNPVDTNGVASHFEALLGIGFVFGRSEPDPDPDHDGVLGEQDRCPAEAGLPPDGCPDRDPDHDGVLGEADQCPTEAGPAPRGCPSADQDGDGIKDADDRCPAEAGPAPDGCPDPDPDHDGIKGLNDQCPNEAGPEPHGCPDRDDDGIRDSVDQCPDQPETKNGIQDADGCPDELPAEVKKFSGVIPGITFQSGRATIHPSSFELLDRAAAVLLQYGAIRLEVSGHTDNQGSAELNRRLSTERAEAVKSYLEAKGVAPERLEARGFGPDKPVADNRTAAGRSKNRRIEFRLLE